MSQAELALRSLGRSSLEVHSLAVGRIYQTFLQQASILAYANVFFYLSILAFCIVPLCFILSNAKVGGGGPSGGH